MNAQKPKAFLTISVDDGHPDDFRVADLLAEFDLRATFYVPRNNPERAVMNESELRSLACRFEIGGHTLSHLSLTSMSLDRAWLEISDGKKWLEDCLSKPVQAFCYPQGKFTSAIAALVEKAGVLRKSAGRF